MSPNQRDSPGSARTLVYILLGFQSILAILVPNLVQACGPGRAGGRRPYNRLRKYPPLVQRQYIPNVSENTFVASGEPEGPIRRHDRRFRELVQNWNPDIEFRDDERTGADRMMSQRLKEKLSVLAISVMNQWPNVRLRVIEGWDEDRRHSPNSLHYEGRAVDITTSDKDRSKYGLLARLAVEAGFDWVHYESRSHVHCSVKSEKADAIRNNGCFDAEGLVETPLGQVEMSQLQTNDLVLAMNPQTGELQFSPVLMWLDRDESGAELYVNLTTKSGRQIRLTSSHLIYLADEPMPPAAPADVAADLSGAAKQPAGSSPQTSGQPKSGNNYYYDFVDEPAAAAGGEETRPGPADRKQGAPSESATRVAGAHLDLNDYVYTTYARNAVAGQYLLVSEPGELLDFGGPPEEAKARREPAANRLTFGRDADGEPAAPINPEARRTGRYKQQRPPAPGPGRASRATLDEIVSVQYVSRRGIYAPLTREGNIVVNSVVASCYAVISDHELAHWSMAPVRWLSFWNEKLFGLRPDTPTRERTLDYRRRVKLYEERRRSAAGPPAPERPASHTAPDYNTTNTLNRTPASSPARHIHWYPILLYNIARYVLPHNYLY